MKKNNKNKNTELKKKVENLPGTKSEEKIITEFVSSYEGVGDSDKLLYDLQVQKIELELQNEKLLKTKVELEEAITKYDDFYDFAPFSYFTFDRSGTILESNLTGTSMLKLERSKLLGRKISEFISSDSSEIFNRTLKKVFDENVNSACQLHFQPDAENSIWAQMQCSAPVTGIKCLAIVSDITDVKNAENELSETKNYLEQLINYANAPIIVWNPDSEIILFNKAFERLTGYTSEEVIGKKLDILFPDPTLSKSRAKIEQTLYGDFLESNEIPILCRNSETKIVLWNSANIYDDNKNLISTIAQGNDITSRKKTENELEESQRKLNLALENGNIGIWEYEVKTRYLFLDERMKNMLEMKKRHFDGTFTSFEKLIHDEDIQQVRESFRKTLENGGPFETIFRVMLKENKSKYLNAKGMLYRDDEGPSRIIGVAIDITEMKKGSESALFRLNEELARSNKELEQFAYVASHDLQEPLRMVSSYTQLLAQRYRDKLDKNAMEYINYAVDGAKRMYELLNGLLAFSRINTRGEFFVDVEISRVLQDVLRNIRLTIETRKVKVQIGNLPVIRADRNQMIQLFQNLISNSIKFSQGVPKITVAAKEQDDTWLFSVKDEGIGIDPEYHERIFQIFQRLFTREEYEGTGIGLSICKRIVERHGGKIWVKSKPGEGSTFLFTIKKEL